MSDFPSYQSPLPDKGKVRIKTMDPTPRTSPCHHSASSCYWKDFQIRQHHFGFCFILFRKTSYMSCIIGLIHIGLAIPKIWPQLILLSLFLAFIKINTTSYYASCINLEFRFRKHFARLKFRCHVLFC